MVDTGDLNVLFEKYCNMLLTKSELDRKLVKVQRNKVRNL